MKILDSGVPEQFLSHLGAYKVLFVGFATSRLPQNRDFSASELGCAESPCRGSVCPTWSSLPKQGFWEDLRPVYSEISMSSLT